jgi:hypothetical protein
MIVKKGTRSSKSNGKDKEIQYKNSGEGGDCEMLLELENSQVATA